MTRVAVALVHHPCMDKAGEVFTTSITNLDVHDIARSARTYGVDATYIVTPIKAQQDLAKSIAGFWQKGKGATRNPSRHAAMERLFVVASIEEALQLEEEALGQAPTLVATSAKRHEAETLSYAQMRDRLPQQPGTLILFGTGHGLAPAAWQQARYVLEPLLGPDAYNHLSVRSAAAIIMDRLLASDRVD